MVQEVMISIRPKWCELIARGQKTIEVRKTRPKLDTPFKCYIYCTRCSSYFRASEHMAFGDDELYRDENRNIKYGCSIELMCADNYDSSYFLNKKVIGEFICDDIDEISVHDGALYCVNNTQPDKLKQMCLTLDEVGEYLGEKNHGYAWHISDLKIYDTPKELSDFYAPCSLKCNYFAECEGTNDEMCLFPLNLPPQSWCYVEENVWRK